MKITVKTLVKLSVRNRRVILFEIGLLGNHLKGNSVDILLGLMSFCYFFKNLSLPKVMGYAACYSLPSLQKQ